MLRANHQSWWPLWDSEGVTNNQAFLLATYLKHISADFGSTITQRSLRVIHTLREHFWKFVWPVLNHTQQNIQGQQRIELLGSSCRLMMIGTGKYGFKYILIKHNHLFAAWDEEILTGCKTNRSSFRGFVRLVPKIINPELMPAEWRALSRLEGKHRYTD